MRIHINLTVKDLDRSIDFYSRLFGTGPSKTQDDYANWRLDEPGLHLALVHDPAFVKPRTGEHFGVELMAEDDLASLQQRVVDDGILVRTEEQVTCCYAVANKFWAADPDGNEWEFWVRSADAESMHDEGMPLDTIGADIQGDVPDGAT